MGLKNDYIHSCKHEIIIDICDMHILITRHCHDCGKDLWEEYELKRRDRESNDKLGDDNREDAGGEIWPKGWVRSSRLPK